MTPRSAVGPFTPDSESNRSRCQRPESSGVSVAFDGRGERAIAVFNCRIVVADRADRLYSTFRPGVSILFERLVTWDGRATTGPCIRSRAG